MKKMKIGFDLHGVVDAVPDFFALITKLLVLDKHEVHIITGHEEGKKLTDTLAKLGIHYTHIFSVSTHLIKEGEKVNWDEKNTPWFDERAWREAKGDYCRRVGIDMHLDDSETYHKYFSTPYIRFLVKR